MMEEQPNLDYINQLACGSESIKNKLINVIKEEFPQEVLMYNENMGKLNLIEVAENVHKIRHKIGFLGLEKAYDLSYDYEQNLRQGSIIFKDDFETVLKKITNFINNL